MAIQIFTVHLEVTTIQKRMLVMKRTIMNTNESVKVEWVSILLIHITLRGIAIVTDNNTIELLNGLVISLSVKQVPRITNSLSNTCRTLRIDSSNTGGMFSTNTINDEK